LSVPRNDSRRIHSPGAAVSASPRVTRSDPGSSTIFSSSIDVPSARSSAPSSTSISLAFSMTSVTGSWTVIATVS
jgi:hypothetical protein